MNRRETIRKEEIWLKDILSDVESQIRENSIEGFKAAVKGLVNDALRALEETRTAYRHRQSPSKLMEKFNLLGHYLDYLKRICEGLV